jgi:hypothetical protein
MLLNEKEFGKAKVKRISRRLSPIQKQMTDQKLQQNVECILYWCSGMTKDVICTREIKSSFVMAKELFK